MAFNQEKALVGALSVIMKPMDRFTALDMMIILEEDKKDEDQRITGKGIK